MAQLFSSEEPDGLRGPQHAGGDDGGDRVGRVVKAVHEVERQRQHHQVAPGERIVEAIGVEHVVAVAAREEQAAQVMAANLALQKGSADNGLDPSMAPQLPRPGSPLVEQIRGG